MLDEAVESGHSIFCVWSFFFLSVSKVPNPCIWFYRARGKRNKAYLQGNSSAARISGEIYEDLPHQF